MTWLQRNRWGLILLVPALVVALAAASFRMVNLYLPWSSDRGIAVENQVVIPSERTLVDYPNNEVYAATLTPVALVPAATGDDYVEFTAAPGARLWRLSVKVEADPEMVLSECSLSLEDAAGTVYEASGGKVSSGEAYVDTWGNLCTNADTPGPSVDLNNVYVPVDPQYARPRNYQVNRYFAIPTGIEPTAVRVSLARSPHWTVPAPVG